MRGQARRRGEARRRTIKCQVVTLVQCVDVFIFFPPFIIIFVPCLFVLFPTPTGWSHFAGVGELLLLRRG